ncbi:hypothetical protein [Microbulbifer litoralis]|uniref:hypothetical protein n=1 Tax=Microbulbifer litoralis TaxID=2933965 RepID=UPI00202788E2|nr:hypothetical protein [Microbulbifer sp. GX H0434]
MSTAIEERDLRAGVTTLCLAIFLVIAAGTARSQSGENCRAEAYRQFDFLLGHWEVLDAKGNRLGENRIEKILGGCAIAENWSGRGHHRGRGYSAYDARRQLWNHSWIDNSGLLMVLEGGIHDGAMIMTGRLQYDLQARERHRVVWQPLGNGHLQRTWQVSGDGGVSWQTAAELLYRPLAGKHASGSDDSQAGRDTQS